MSKKISEYKQILNVLEKLHSLHPKYNLGKHLATALDGHDLWGVSDRSVLLALKKYKTELEIDTHHKEEDIEEIIKGGMHLENIFEEED
jgi:hypothetical protein